MYLATVIDLDEPPRRRLGDGRSHAGRRSSTDALQMAIDLRRPHRGFIFHSD